MDDIPTYSPLQNLYHVGPRNTAILATILCSESGRIGEEICKSMVHARRNAIWLTLGMALLSTKGHACTVVRMISNVEMVKAADAIVRATAVEYAQPPSDSRVRAGVPDSRIRFKVIETVEGHIAPDVILPGYLVSTDDFNDQMPPYSLVRPGGQEFVSRTRIAAMLNIYSF
jgi:hypothetical protein